MHAISSEIATVDLYYLLNIFVCLYLLARPPGFAQEWKLK